MAVIIYCTILYSLIVLYIILMNGLDELGLGEWGDVEGEGVLSYWHNLETWTVILTGRSTILKLLEGWQEMWSTGKLGNMISHSIDTYQSYLTLLNFFQLIVDRGCQCSLKILKSALSKLKSLLRWIWKAKDKELERSTGRIPLLQEEAAIHCSWGRSG